MRRCATERWSTVTSRVAVALLSVMAAMPGSAQGATVTQTLVQANQALQAGEADKALELLHSRPQGGADSAEAQNIACRVHFTLQQWDAAVAECERATQLDGQNSSYHLWLGRALGEKASRVSFMSAYSLGKRVRTEFEAAVRLNPRSAEALMDLGEFYKQAPGVLGGGMDKAAGVAAQLDKVDLARGHQLRARIARQGKDYATAEREFKQAIATAAQPALYWTALASFYEDRSRWQDMESAIRSAESAAERDRRAAVAFYDGAGLLVESRRDPDLAAKMLNEYLASPSKTEEAPAFEAHVRLARVKKQMGDAAGAQRELAAALQLAHDYKPALEFKH